MRCGKVVVVIKDKMNKSDYNFRLHTIATAWEDGGKWRIRRFGKAGVTKLKDSYMGWSLVRYNPFHLLPHDKRKVMVIQQRKATGIMPRVVRGKVMMITASLMGGRRGIRIEMRGG